MDGMFEVLNRPEGADRLTVVVVVVVGHLDAAVEGMEPPMSNFQYFLLFCDLLLLFLANLFSLTGVKGLEFLFLWLSFFSSLCSAIFFLTEEKGFTCLLHGLYEVTWIVHSLLQVWMLSTVQMVISTSTMSLGKAQ